MIIHHLNDKVIVVETKHGSYNYEVEDSILFYDTTDFIGGGYELPPGSWSILSRGNECEAKDAQWIVEREWDGSYYWYKNYEETLPAMFKSDPIRSLQSFHTSKGLDINRTIILKRD